VSPDYHKYNVLFEAAVAIIDEVDAGRTSTSAARDQIFALLAAATYAPPVYPFTDPSTRYSVADQDAVARVKEWVAAKAPEDIRKLYFDVTSHAWL
jgi:hypothetical protein